MKTLAMRPTEVIQNGIRITQKHPDNVVIEMNGSSITLTAENTELLRIMLYEAYRSQRWKSSRAEKSARNKALWTLAKARSKKCSCENTQTMYKRLKKETETVIDIGKLDITNVGIGELDFSDISFGELNIEDIKLPDIGDIELPDYSFKDLGL